MSFSPFFLPARQVEKKIESRITSLDALEDSEMPLMRSFEKDEIDGDYTKMKSLFRFEIQRDPASCQRALRVVGSLAMEVHRIFGKGCSVST